MVRKVVSTFRDHAPGALAAIVGAAIVVEAVSVASTQEAHEFWNYESRRLGRDRGWNGWDRNGWGERRDEPSARITVTPQDRGGVGATAAGSYCVRTCDAYYFPLSRASRVGASAQSLCDSLCPGAETQVYSLPAGGESFADARSSRGQLYAKLVNAFAYRDSLQDGCSCRSATRPPLTLAQDPTLRAGDIVVTEAGVRVFRGGRAQPPHNGRDFVDYRKQRGISGRTRAYLDAIDRPYRARRAARAEPAPEDAMAQSELSSRTSKRKRRSRR
ncbi:MAG: DUF2865 domain-containing protein [Xanthobacteraceae bacterium]